MMIHLPRNHRRIGAVLLGFLVILAAGFPPSPVQADIAPPDKPPGANPLPGAETTHVRMAAETVVIDVQKTVAGGALPQALVKASFVMQNLGDAAEKMDVRFPLSFWNGGSDGFGNYPEIHDISVKVNGVATGTRRVTTPNLYSQSKDNPIPWASFPVAFPTGKDTQIDVTYRVDGMGEYPYVAFKYILETGAGWAGSIGSAELVVRLPYLANTRNVIYGPQTGFSETTPGSTLTGREVHWHYEAFGPDPGENLDVSLVVPEAWQKVLTEQENVARNPADGEAWGRLGKAAKEIILLRRGMREDPGGLELYQLSREAYAKSVSLLPEDSLWHTGYAGLLWNHFYWEVFLPHPGDYAELKQALDELKIALDLNPKNQLASDLLQEIQSSLPGVVGQSPAGGEYFVSTATPWPTRTPAPTPTSPPTPTPAATELPPPTQTRAPVLPAENASVSPTVETSPQGFKLPVCGSGLILPLVITILFLGKRRRPG